MQDWETRLNSFIEMFEYGLLKDSGKVSAAIAKLHAESEFEKYRIIQDRIFMSDYDKYLIELEEQAKKAYKSDFYENEPIDAICLYILMPFSVRHRYSMLQTMFKSSSSLSVLSGRVCCIQDIIRSTMALDNCL